MKKIDQYNSINKRFHITKRSKRHSISKQNSLCKRARRPWGGKRQLAKLASPFACAVDGNENRRTVLRFFQKLRELCLERRLRVTIDFSSCEVTTVSGMLLFIAELDRIKRILEEEFDVNIENVKNRRVNQLLNQIGVYELCGIKQPNANESNFDDTVKHWRYATGGRVNENANKAFMGIEGRLSTELAKGMWKSISEAVINSVQHAYSAPRGVNGGRLVHPRWWMFSQEKDHKLTVAVCDLGIGIPRSLPMNWEQSLLKRVLAGFATGGNDSKAIKAALEIGASSTGASYRGKGLAQIWNTLRLISDASVSILSNSGRLTWNSEHQREYQADFSNSINGTIISWTVSTNSTDGIL